MMRIYLDYHGTLVNNPLGVDERGLKLCLRSLNHKHEVVIWSGDSQSIHPDFRAWAEVAKIRISDKLDLDVDTLRGAVIVDDDPIVLSVAVRAGAIAVPAARIRDFFMLLT